MRTKLFIAVAMFLLFAFAVTVSAQEHFGIKVYPGAKADRLTEGAYTVSKPITEQMIKATIKKPLKIEAYCYRAGDDYAKVIDFYKKQKAVEPLDIKDKGPQKISIFCAPGANCATLFEGGLNVNISSPWSDGNAQMNDTLIVIMRTKK